jgi:predicted phage terminase large subunit-like protein
MIEIPGAPIGEEDDEAADGRFLPVETPPAAHHKLLIEKLQDIADGRSRRAMIFLPPGSAKSTFGSVVFPAWMMGRKLRLNIGVATYATELARRVGRRVRSIARQPVYREIFKTGLAADQQAANEWALENGNEFLGNGILAGWTGHRLDGLIIDDPTKNREEADSAVIQAKVRAEYDDSLKSRLKPHGFVVLIMTRWAQLDLAGSLLPEDWDGESGSILCRDGLVWEVLCIPAEAEQNDPLGRQPGQMLWDEWFGKDPDFWTAARQNPRTWSALYQQRPSPESGTYFMRQWFDGGEVEGRAFECKRYLPGELPTELRKYGTSDYAVKESDRADFTVHRVWGVDPEGDIWLVGGGYRAQETSDKWIEAVIDQMELHRPYAWFGEAGVIQLAIEPALLRRMKERDVMCRLEWLSSIQDKPTRARGFQARAAMGTVHIPYGPEGDAILDEYVRFPAGRNDDDVDTGSLIGRALDMAHPAIVKPAPKPLDIRGVSDMTLDEMLSRQDRLNGGYQRIS